MEKPLWSVVVIAKNEENHLPRLLESLNEFRAAGGQVVVVDTGSSDKTYEIAQNAHCVAERSGNDFVATVSEVQAKKINRRFVEAGEAAIVKAGATYFDYSSARNYAASLASCDFISMPDCDEVFTKLDIEAINKAIRDGADQLEYNFVFAHGPNGEEVVKFMHSKFYNRTKMKWVGVIHEVLDGVAKRQFLPESVIKLEHFQNPDTNRKSYLTGLAIDCQEHPDNDRNSHYLARELMWNGRPKSAIKEFKRHIAMNRWLAERAQSMIFIGDCHGMLGQPREQLRAYSDAYELYPDRREPLVKTAEVFKRLNRPMGVLAYASAALALPRPKESFYGDNELHYREIPHMLAYFGAGWVGKVEEAKEHLKQALAYAPENGDILRDIRYYFKLPFVSIIIPTLGREEKLKRLLGSIKSLCNYPEGRYEIIVKQDQFPPNNIGVPKLLAAGVKESRGELVMYLSNDCVPQAGFLIQAVWVMMEKSGQFLNRLVCLNDGVWKGQLATHWLAGKNLLIDIDQDNFFHLGYHHAGCDNELTGLAKLANRFEYAPLAKVSHEHDPNDEVSKVAYDPKYLKQDCDLLLERARALGFDPQYVPLASDTPQPSKPSRSHPKPCLKPPGAPSPSTPKPASKPRASRSSRS